MATIEMKLYENFDPKEDSIKKSIYPQLLLVNSIKQKLHKLS